MGQKIGKAALIEEVDTFTNLPRRAIANLWQTFNNVADGFGVSTEELEEICSDLKDELNISRVSILERTSALFKIYDTDKNGLIDALEFFASIAVLSGMKKSEILEFILTIYDFDGTQTLSMDEVVLALKSACVGLCKVQVPNKQETREKIVIAKEEQIEQLVSFIFHSPSNSSSAAVRSITSGGGTAPTPAPSSYVAVDDNFRLNIKLLCSLLGDHPDISTWFAFFKSPTQKNLPTYDQRELDVDYEHENQIVERSAQDLDAVNWNVLCVTEKKEYESASNPWISPVAMLTPIIYATQNIRKDAPDTSMTPEWIFGYQSERCKNNVSYNYNGDLVYTVSRFAVVYNFKENAQGIFTGHTEEISCFKIHPDKQLVATGECGPNPRLLLWHSVSMKISYASHAKHQRGILQIAFSSDGKQILSIGNDRQHTLQVVSWEDDVTLYSCQVHADRARACVIMPNNTLIVAGDSYIHFWNRSSSLQGGYVRREGIYTRYCSHQPIVSLEPVFGTDNVVAGTVGGQLLLWVDCNCVRNVQGHSGAVSSLFSSAHGLISGGKDSRIRMWTSNLEPGFTFDVSHFAFNPSVRAISASQDGTSILFGTRGANIFEISAIDGSDLRGGPIAVGHSFGDLNCLAVHPSKFEFLSVGQDCTLRVFEMISKSQLKVATFDGEALTVTYSPLGDLIVIGFGGASHSAKCGTYIVLAEEDLSLIHEAKDCHMPITAIQFSPEGETLAVGAGDGSIFVYSVVDDYEMVAKCTRHTSPVLSIDFSVDGEWIRSNSQDKELCFFNSDDGALQSNIASMRDVEWATNNCMYTWHQKSIHRNPFPNEAVTCTHTPYPAPEYLAFGTSLGYIQLRTFPCVNDECESIRYPAHYQAVSSVKFIFDSSRLISMGLKDRAIVQWRCVPYSIPPIEADKRQQDKEKTDDLALESRSGEQLVPDFMAVESNVAIGLLNGIKSDPIDLLPTPDNDVWITGTVEPTVLPTIHTNIPQMSVVLEHVYGYESQTLRNNVRYTKEGDVVYVTATLGVVLNLTNKAQKIYQYHTDAITSFTSSVDGSLVATGQMGHAAQLVVWNTKTCKTVFKLPELQLHSVCACAFSPGDEYLAVVGNDSFHTITVYNWKANICVSKFFGGGNQILGVCFFRSDKDELGLVSYGLGELKFWTGVTGRNPIAMKPVYGEIGAAQNFLCCEIFVNSPTLGTSDGNLYVFDGHMLKHAVKAHNGAVNAIHSAVNRLVTGGHDGVIRLWNEQHECTKEFAVDNVITSFNPKVRSVCLSPDGKRIVVGTRGAEIFELNVKDGKLIHGKPLVEFHGNRLLCGMASHPTKDEFATAGDDATLRIWDTKQYAVTKSIKLDTPSRAVCYSSDGKLMAVGFGNGKRTKGKLAPKEGAFMILKTADWKVSFEGKDSNAFIRVIKFSPDGKILAVGSEDNCIYVYNAKDSYSKRNTLRFHQSPIVSLDFNPDGNYLLSSDTSKRFVLSEVINGIQIPTPESLRDEKWSSYTAAIGWPVKGFWMIQPPGVEPCTAQRSWGGLLLAVGNTAGKVTIAHNPTPSKAGFIQCAGHAGAISGIVWIAGDGTLMSCGVNDHTVLQWKCIYDATRESGDEGGRSCDDSELEYDCGHDKQLVLAERAALEASRAIPLVTTTVNTTSGSFIDVSGGTVMVDGAVSNERWLATITPPTQLPYEDMSPLDQSTCDLEFIQGARLSDSRQNIRYNCEGNLIYLVSTFGVIYNRNTVHQIFYHGHANAVLSLDVNKTGDLCATGEVANNPEIHIWDSRTGIFVQKFTNVHKIGVSSLSFSQSGDYLVSLGQDVNHSIAIFYSPTNSWHDGYCINTTSVSSNKMLWCLFTENNQFPIAVGGAGGIFFYRLVRNGAERMKGTFGKRVKIQPVLCAACYEGGSGVNAAGGECVLVTGTVSGHLYLFQDCKVINKVSAHEAPVYAVTVTKQGYLSAGKDGVVKLFSFDFKLLQGFKLNSFNPKPFSLCIHSLASNASGTTFVTAMKSGEIYETCFASQSSVQLFESHSTGELHAIDVNPTNNDQYVTVGEDGVVRIWSISRRYCLMKAMIEFPSRAVAWSPNGERIVLGIGTGTGVGSSSSKDGAFIVLDASNLEIIREDRKSKQYITDIKFAPNGQKIAFAAGDGRVYLHDSNSHYPFIASIETPAKNCSVTRIDFSTDSKCIRLATSSRELFYYSIDQQCLVSSPMTLRDVQFHVPSVSYSWNTQGIYDRSASDVLSSAINAQFTIIAASYLDGSLRLYRYPCQSQQVPFLVIPGVATKTTRLRFSKDGNYLLVVDALVRSVLQYKIVG